MAEPLVLTSFTTVTAIGRGNDATFAALGNERSGLRPCDFPGVELATYIGRVEGLEDEPVATELAAFDCRNNRLAQIALHTDGFAEAVRTAAGRYGAGRVAVVIGTSTSGVQEGERAYQHRAHAEAPLPDSFHFESTQDHFSVTDFVRRSLGLGGPAVTISAACASSNKVFADAAQLIQTGMCDAAVVGGVDSLCLLTLRGFGALELLSPEACRPNDADRAGISIGEAAGFALLERASALEPRSTAAVALLGYGESSDAFHMSAPHPEGKGAEMAMRAALSRAGLAPEQIDYINMHGTGSAMNDKAEDRSIQAVFGRSVPASSTKGWTGHTLGAAGIIESVIAALAITRGFAPGNLNLRRVDPEFGSWILPHGERREIKAALSNSFGFGGNNCSIILGALS